MMANISFLYSQSGCGPREAKDVSSKYSLALLLLGHTTDIITHSEFATLVDLEGRRCQEREWCALEIQNVCVRRGEDANSGRPG